MTTLQGPAKRMLTSEEAASYCGVSINTFKHWVRVPPVKIGAAVRYDRVALDKWADSLDPAAELTADDWLRKFDEGGGERT